MKLKINGLLKRFGDHCALDSVTLDLDGVGVLALIGPSGGGKSTLLRILAGLEYPDQGSVAINGKPLVFQEDELQRHRRGVGVVFQAFNLFPHLSALENILLPLEKVHQLSPQDARQTALDLLGRFQLGAHAGKRPAELSGGQQQRVAIVRALAIKPSLLLFDEPTSALDPEMTAEVLGVIEELKKEGRDFILVTHQMAFARRVADRVAFLAGGQILECSGAGDLFDHPATTQCREFLAKTLKY